MTAQASRRFLMTKSLKAFFSMSGKEQEGGQPQKTANFGLAAPSDCKPFRRKSRVAKVDPGRRGVARPFAAAHLRVDARRLEPLRRRRVEQEMVDADAGIAREGV